MGGCKIWFDEDVLRLNTDGRGKYVGEFQGEDRILVASPKVATYDLQPEMSAYEVADKLVEAIKSDKYDVIITNFANPDMVGHTGVEAAAIKAVEAVDECVGKAVQLTNQGDTLLLFV